MFNDKKLEISIAGLVALLFVSSGYFLMRVEKTVGIEQFIESYVMPRPKALFNSLFNLDQREVERDYKNPFAKKAQAQKKDATKPGQPAVNLGGPNPQQAQKVASQKKSKKSKKKKSNVEVTVVEATQGTLSDLSPLASGNSNYGGSGERAPQSPVAVSVQSPKVDNQSANLGPDQWRSLMMAQPTSENLQKFMTAYSKNEIESRAYYLVINDLLSSTKTEVQALGLEGLAAFPSIYSFQMLVSYEEELSKDHSESLQKIFATYEQASRNGILISAMQTNDKSVVMRAIEISLKSYAKAKEQGQGNDATLILIGFARFVPVLQILSTNEDPQISQLATGALSQLQSVAAN